MLSRSKKVNELGMVLCANGFLLLGHLHALAIGLQANNQEEIP